MTTMKHICRIGKPLRHYRLLGGIRRGSDAPAKGEKPFYPDYAYGPDSCPKFDFIEEIRQAPRMSYGEDMAPSVIPSRVCFHMSTWHPIHLIGTAFSYTGDNLILKWCSTWAIMVFIPFILWLPMGSWFWFFGNDRRVIGWWRRKYTEHQEEYKLMVRAEITEELGFEPEFVALDHGRKFKGDG